MGHNSFKLGRDSPVYYQHSGRFSFGGVVLGLGTGLAAGALLAYAYGRGIIVIPEVHFAVLATLAFGGLLGLAVGLGLHWGKVRNKVVAIAVSATASALGLYLSWAVWIADIYHRGTGKNTNWARLAQHPRAVWSFMKWINQYGTWGLDSGGATKGWALWGIWSLEAVFVIGLGIFATVAIQQQIPFCEACNRWCRRGAQFLLAPPANPLQLKPQLENDGLRTLQELGPGSKFADRLMVSLHSCQQCGLFHTMTVTSVTRGRKKFGHPHVSFQSIVRHLVVNPGEAEALRQLSEKITQAPKLAAERARGAAAGS